MDNDEEYQNFRFISRILIILLSAILQTQMEKYYTERISISMSVVKA